jgi:hypothetical protein
VLLVDVLPRGEEAPELGGGDGSISRRSRSSVWRWMRASRRRSHHMARPSMRQRRIAPRLSSASRSGSSPAPASIGPSASMRPLSTSTGSRVGLGGEPAAVLDPDAPGARELVEPRRPARRSASSGVT